jgi:hypothetical protein
VEIIKPYTNEIVAENNDEAQGFSPKWVENSFNSDEKYVPL